MKNLLSIESLTRDEILRILDLAVEMKATRGRHQAHPLRHRCWGMIFNKSSTRTRVSFEGRYPRAGRGRPVSQCDRFASRQPR